MDKTIVYHNPRCSKSRQCLSYLDDKNIDYDIRLYMKEALTLEELEQVIAALGIDPIDLVRTGEKVWKESYKGLDMSRDDIMKAMLDHPRLIQRPIVVKGDRAVIARPMEMADKVLK